MKFLSFLIFAGVIALSFAKANKAPAGGKSQWDRKFKKIEAKNLVKSNNSIFFIKLHFWQF